MGLFAEWVMMKAVTVPHEAIAARFANEGLRVAHDEDGWSLGSARGHELDALVGRLNQPTPEPVLAGWIYDSDVAYLTGAGPEATRFALVIGSPVESADEELDPALVRLAGEEGRRESAGACATWSQTNAQAVAASDVLEILERDWTLAEEGVSALVEVMRVPNPLSFTDLPGPSQKTGVVISLSTHLLATLSADRLLRRVSHFSRPHGTSFDGATIELHLDEAAAAGPQFDELMAEVQRFADEIGLPRLTVFAAGRSHPVHRHAPLNFDG